MQVTSVLFGFMLCLADACLALEDGCRLSFFHIKVHNSACAVSSAAPSLPVRAG